MKPARLLVAAVLVLAPSAAAQLTEQQAVQQVKAAAKAQLKAYKAAGKATLVVLDADLATLEATFSASDDSATLAAQVGGIAAGIAAGIHNIADSTLDFVDAAVALALEDLADGTDLQGLYPEDLYTGEGGVLDDFRDDLFAAIAKTQAAAIKRLAKTVKRAEQDSGIALRVALRLPAPIADGAANQDGLLTLAVGPSLDVAVSASRFDATGDGTIVLAGQTDITDEDVDLSVSGQESESDLVTPSAETGRFLGVLNLSGAGLGEGNYVGGVAPVGGPFTAALAIGVP